MEEILLKNYVSKLTKENIINYIKKENINASDNDINIIYEYIKKYFMIFYKGDPTYLFNELKDKLSKTAYEKAQELYKKYKKS